MGKERITEINGIKVREQIPDELVKRLGNFWAIFNKGTAEEFEREISKVQFDDLLKQEPKPDTTRTNVLDTRPDFVKEHDKAVRETEELERLRHSSGTTRDLPEYPNKATGSPEKGNQITTPSSDKELRQEFMKEFEPYVDKYCPVDSIWNWILSHAKELGELV